MVPDRDVLAVVLHDAVCPDRRCDPQVFGDEFKRADALLASDWLVAITADRDTLAAKVARVEALAERWALPFPNSDGTSKAFAARLRAALTEDAS